MQNALPNVEQVRRAKARYARFVDTKEWEQLAELLEPALQFRMLDPAGNVVNAFNDRDSFMDAVRGALDGAQSIHQVHNDEIDQVSDAEISAIWSMEDVIIFRPGAEGPRRMHGYGHYHELWRLGPNGWRFSRVDLRRTILEFSNA